MNPTSGTRFPFAMDTVRMEMGLPVEPHWCWVHVGSSTVADSLHICMQNVHCICTTLILHMYVMFWRREVLRIEPGTPDVRNLLTHVRALYNRDSLLVGIVFQLQKLSRTLLPALP